MSFPRYPVYRDTGAEWLPEVPSHWEVKRLRYVAEINPSKSEVAHLPDSTEFSFLPMEAIGETGAIDLSRTRALAEVSNGYSFFANGDVIFAKVTPCFENGKGALLDGLHGGYGFGTTELIVVRPHQVDDGTFLRWLTSSEIFRKPAEGEMTGAGGLKRVPEEFVATFPVAWPPEQERRAVATFLDRETAKIDALVEAQRRLIELLKEKRQAVISHAVTKGLDPTVPMKNSGIEWLGEVPAHWTVTRLKFVARIQTGVAKGKDVTGKEIVSVPYLRVANVQDGHIDLSDLASIEIPASEMERYLLRPGDVLMNEGGDFDKLGRGGVWHGEVSPCIHQNHVFAVRPFGVSSAWLNAVTGSSYAQFFFMGRSKQSTNLASISSSNIMELPVVVPPPPEQEWLLTELSREDRRIAALSAEAQSAITLLQERRAALISAAVTGKIDVRGLAAADAEAA